MSLIANQHYSCRSEGSQVHIVPIVAQDVSEDMVSKDQQMALVLAARQESNDNQPSNEQKQNDGTVKKKPAGRPKGKAKSKAKAGTHAAAPKPEAKAKSKSQPKAKAKSKSQPRKRPAASLAQEAEAKRPTAFMAQEAEAKSPTASMAQEGVPESNDAKPEAPKVKGGNLPHTFGRRAKPSTASGLAKYEKIVQAFRDEIEPRIKPRGRTVAEDCLPAKL